MATDRIRDLIDRADRHYNLADASHTTNARHIALGTAERLQREALTLAICELLDSGLVLADPDEIKPEGSHTYITISGADRFLGDRARRAIDDATEVPPVSGG